MENGESRDKVKMLLDLYLKGRLSAREQARMDKHLDDFQKHDGESYDFNQKHQDDLWKRIAAKTTETSNNNRRRPWIWMAAAIVLTSVGVLITLSWNPDKPRLSNKIFLNDGTIVWLKNDSELDQSRFTINNREVTLQGEALFEVAKMSGRPFVIHCGTYEARVL